MTKTNRSNSGRSIIDSDAAIAPSESSGENAANPSSASSFVLTNDRPRGPMTRLMALRMTMRRVQLTTHSLETEVLARHSRKARLKHCFAASEFAVSNMASLCKATRSQSNTPTNSSLRAYSHLSLTALPNQRTFITLVSPYALHDRSRSIARCTFYKLSEVGSRTRFSCGRAHQTRAPEPATLRTQERSHRILKLRELKSCWTLQRGSACEEGTPVPHR
jgi:hypothetical protein